MDTLTKEQLMKALEYFDTLGFSKDSVIEGGEVLDLYRVLGVNPDVTKTGRRKQTPYEILGVPPQTTDGESERPIVFAIKNRAKRIGNYTGEFTTFFYKSNKVKDERSILEELKVKYKRALLMGNEAEAEKFLELIDQVTGGGAQEFLDSFYDYTKFYRKMKKQLLIDMFSHFFLMFMIARTKKATIKKGLLKSDRVYKAYKEAESEYDYEKEYNEALNQMLAASAAVSEMPVVTNINFVQEFDDLETDTIKVNKKVSKMTAPAPPPPPEPVIEQPQENNLEMQEEQKEEFKFPTSLQDFFSNIGSYAGLSEEELSVGDTVAMSPAQIDPVEELDLESKQILADQGLLSDEQLKEFEIQKEQAEQKKAEELNKNKELFEGQELDFQA